MEEKPRSAISNGIYFGSITGAALIVFSLIMFLLDLYLNKTVSWLSYLILAGGMFYGTFDYRKNYTNGFMTYGKAFSSCFWIGLFGGVLISVYMFVFARFIHPGFVNEILEKARENMVNSSQQMTEEQIDTALEYTRKFTTPVMMVVWSLVMYAASSAIIALILAFFLKKEDPSLNTTV